ncbi:MarR family transcriptional regulator [Streptomyces sp. NPDC051940]|uniref:MarR family winged helix-turn-helix transcriptional regulator n=1 Tax=Streptomyces sp. NPDC051940 TaxID=3155675 RepID=UPI003420416B
MEDSVDRHVAVWAREIDGLDAVKEAIIARLALLGRRIAATRRESLAAGDLRQWQFKVLLILRRQGPPYTASPSELADQLGLTRGALSARLAPLEDAGLITRVADAADRRRVHVALTPPGNATLERQLTSEDEGELALLAPLTPAERATLATLLRKLVLAVETPDTCA